LSIQVSMSNLQPSHDTVVTLSKANKIKQSSFTKQFNIE